MNEQLEQRWKSGKAPFDGQCIRLTHHVPLPTLRLLLRTIVDVLQERKRDCTLYRFDDWHEHDGYVTEARATDWETLNQILLNDQTLHHSRHGDAYVRWAYYPDDLTFLLRYDVLDPDEEPELSEPEGDCDICADADIVDVCIANGTGRPTGGRNRPGSRWSPWRIGCAGVNTGEIRSRTEQLTDLFEATSAKTYFDGTYAG